MRIIKKLLLTVLLTITMVTTSTTPIFGHTGLAHAATIKISKKTLTLEVGKKATLKITGTTKQVKWSSNNKAVVAVTSKGKITAITAGTATITASVSNKKLTCKVTVPKPVNPYLKNAPFDAVEVQIENINLVMPSDWIGSVDPVDENNIFINLKPSDTSLKSSLVIGITLTNEKAPKYSVAKKEFLALLTLDSITKKYADTFGDTVYEIKDLTQIDLKTSYGTILKSEYTIATPSSSLKQAIYDLYLDNYFIEVTTNDVDELDLITITEYMINSIIIK